MTTPIFRIGLWYHAYVMQPSSTRYFNTLRIDHQRQTITKTSTDASKLHNEIRWYQHLPAALQPMAAELISALPEATHPSLTLAYYPCNNLGELLLSDDLTPTEWKAIGQAIAAVRTALHAHNQPLATEKVVARLRAMYVEKTCERLQQLQTHQVVGMWFVAPIVINGQEYPLLSEIDQQLATVVEEVLLAGEVAALPWSCIHGDFCLSNMLYLADTSEVKLIDPRGSFGGPASIYGDPRYDDAKLLHSIHGHYDWLTHQQFTVEGNGSATAPLRYHLQISPRQEQNLATLRHELFGDTPPSLALQLIEALLFLSMVPLHADQPNAQLVMLAQGIEQFAAVRQRQKEQT